MAAVCQVKNQMLKIEGTDSFLPSLNRNVNVRLVNILF